MACETFGVRLSHPELLLEIEMEWLGEALRAELLESGVLCVVEHALVGVTGITTRRRVRIYVDADDLPRARETLNHRRLQHTRLEEAGHWRCGRCGEEVPGDFARCWACGDAGPDGDGDGAAGPTRDGAVAASPIVDPSWRRGRGETRGRGIALLGAASFAALAGAAILAGGQAGPALLVLVVAAILAVAGATMLLWAR